MGSPGILEILIVALILIILFGSKRIPGIFKAVAGSIKEFKKGLRDKSSENN